MRLFNLISRDILLAFFVLTLCLFLISNWIEFGNLSLLFGICCFIITPGLYAVSILGKSNLDIIGYGLILGLAIIFVNMSLYSVFSFALGMNFLTYLISSTVITITILKIISLKRKVTLDFSSIKASLGQSLKSPPLYIFIFALLFHYYFSLANSTSMQPDAALYLDSSRTLVTKGIFSSNILYDDTYSRMTTIGLIDHTFVTYIFSLFFQIYNISFGSALLSVVFVSALLVYPVFDIAGAFFGKLAGILSALILTIHPLFIYYSSILFGPEISGLLFLLVSFYFIIEGAKQGSVAKLVIAGILLGISEEFWWANFYIVLPFVPLMVALFYGGGPKRIRDKRFAINLLLSGFVIFLFGAALKLSSLYFLFVPVIIIETLFFVYSFRTRSPSILMPLSITLGLIITTIGSVVRHYTLSSTVGSVVKNVVETGLVPSALNAFTGFFKGSFATGFIQYLSFLSSYGTLIILFVFILALLNFKNLKIKILFAMMVLFISIIISLMPPPIYPQYLSSEGRYFLLPISLMIIIASSFFSKTIRTVLSDAFSATLRITVNIGKKVSAIRLPSIFAIVLILTILIVFFIPAYQNNTQTITKENPIDKYLWTQNMLDWIQNNTDTQDVLLTSRARELAWLTNRQTVAITTSSTMSPDFAFDRLANLSQEFNATYLIADDHLYWNSPQLRDLCTESNVQNNNVFLPENDLISLIANGTRSNDLAYQLVFSFKNNHLQIWKIVSPQKIFLETHYLDLATDTWHVGNGGQKSLNSNAVQVTIGPGQVYTYTYSRNSLNLTLRENSVPFFAWNLTDINNAEVKRIEFWTNGINTFNIIPSSQIGEWISPIDATTIDDLRVVISGNSTGFAKINWLCVGTYYCQD